MESTITSKIMANPSLVWIIAGIGFYLVNLFLGLFMAFQGRSPQRLRIHRLLYFGFLVCLISFLVMNQIHHENTIWDYLVGAYFITIVPLSKRWDILLHAFFAVVGLTFLPLLIILQLI